MTDWWYLPTPLDSLSELIFKLSHIRDSMEDNFSIVNFALPNLPRDVYVDVSPAQLAQAELAVLDVLIRASGKAFARRAIWDTVDEWEIFDRQTAGDRLKWFMRKRIEWGTIRLL
ncbi:hypothetical protein LTR50_002122 [Elasticomyces elasticus]|nr:hypothetical protein LTR50_002122 [Elasticomyces elasticus]